MYCLTPPTSLCSDNTQNLHRSTVERIPRQCQHPRWKVNVLSNTLILANQKYHFRYSIGKSKTNIKVSNFVYYLSVHVHTCTDCILWTSAHQIIINEILCIADKLIECQLFDNIIVDIWFINWKKSDTSINYWQTLNVIKIICSISQCFWNLKGKNLKCNKFEVIVKNSYKQSDLRYLLPHDSSQQWGVRGLYYFLHGVV